MRQEPREQLRVVVRLGPRVVLRLGIDGELDVGAEALEGLDHLLGARDGDRGVLGAVEDPDGEVLELLRRRLGAVARAPQMGAIAAKRSGWAAARAHVPPPPPMLRPVR